MARPFYLVSATMIDKFFVYIGKIFTVIGEIIVGAYYVIFDNLNSPFILILVVALVAVIVVFIKR